MGESVSGETHAESTISDRVSECASQLVGELRELTHISTLVNLAKSLFNGNFELQTIQRFNYTTIPTNTETKYCNTASLSHMQPFTSVGKASDI